MAISVSFEVPCLLVRFAGTASDAEYQRFLDDLRMGLTGRLGSRQRIALVNDARHGFRATPAQNARHSAWLRDHRPLLLKTLACTAFVVPDEYGQTVLNITTKENRAAVETQAFADYDAAVAWARLRVARSDAGSLPPKTA